MPQAAPGLHRSLAAVLLFSCSLLMTACSTVPPAAREALAPQGTMRAAINFGNPILANKDANGQPVGVSVDLARELAQRLA